MTEPRSGPPGIEIPAEVAAAAGVPEDLDANVTDEYGVPDTARRRQAAFVYVTAAALTAVTAASGLGRGFWLLSIALILIGAHHFAAGRALVVRERQVLDLANQATSFAVGHAAVALGFDGVLARPVWNVLVFSADEPPSERGLVRVDALDGSVVEQYVEPVEDGS